MEGMEGFVTRVEKVIEHASLAELAKFRKEMEPLFEGMGFRSGTEGSMSSILLINPGVIGDNILATPFLRELRRNRFSSRITLVTTPIAYPLMETCPYVNEVLSFEMPNFDRGDDFREALRRIAAFCRTHIWPHRYDMCMIIMWGGGALGARLLAYLSGIRERWGYSERVQNLYMPFEFHPKDEGYLMTHLVENRPEIIHEAERYLHLLEVMGLEVSEKRSELWLEAGDIRHVRELAGDFGRDGILVAFSTGAGGAGRQYPVAQWIEAMGEIVRLGGRILLIGGASEAEEGNYLLECLPAGKVLNLIGRTTVRESAAVIAEADLFMGNDSGMMHAAAALGKPIIAVYREAEDKEGVCTGVLSEFRRFEPYMADYIVLRPEHALPECRDKLCYGGCASPAAHCIAQVRPEEVVEAFRIMTHREESGNRA